MTHQDTQAKALHERGVHTTAAVTIQRDAATLYAAWRKIGDLPRFIEDLLSVDVVDEKMSRWTVRGPGGSEYQWTAEIIADKPGSLLAWRTSGHPDVPLAGSIRFREMGSDRGTQVHVTLEHIPPGAALGDRIGRWMSSDARTKVRGALYRFKQVMETGEFATSRGHPAVAGRDQPSRSASGESKRSDVRDIASGEVRR